MMPVAMISRVETAATLGSIPISTDEKIRTGRVVWFAPTRKIVTGTLSSDVMKAKSAPATRPGRISGSVTSQVTALVDVTAAKTATPASVAAGAPITFVATIGNTGPSTIPLALSQASEAGRLTPGMQLVLAGFGVGLSWAGAALTW